jgi:hypothetical protein
MVMVSWSLFRKRALSKRQPVEAVSCSKSMHQLQFLELMHCVPESANATNATAHKYDL